jgi:acyl transferase domain-containing protein/enoyl-CoA hydratase/carnithine racemase/acyl carrier protein
VATISAPPAKPVPVRAAAVRPVAILGVSGAYSAPGTALAGRDLFDAAFFRIAPLDAELMDPQQRLFLEHCWLAMEDAGFDASALRGRRVGVFAAVHRADYLEILQSHGIQRAQAVTGNALGMVANRVSYCFDLRGPSVVFDSGAAGALTALARAFDAVATGECDLALAGGVHLNLLPHGAGSGDGAGVVLVGSLPGHAARARLIEAKHTNADAGLRPAEALPAEHLSASGIDRLIALCETLPAGQRATVSLVAEGRHCQCTLEGVDRPPRLAPRQPLERRRFWHDSYAQAATPAAGVVGLEVRDGGIAVVTLRDLDHRNMFSQELVDGLAGALQSIAGDGRVRAVVLTNEGPWFAMGGTQQSLADIADGKYSYTDLPVLYEGLLRCQWPVVAAMRGSATGAGFIFGLYADVVLLAEESTYAGNFMKLGITPGLGATHILPHRLGAQLASEMMLTADSFSGAQLRAKGVPFRVVPREQILDEALAVARSFLGHSAEQLTALKQSLAAPILEQLSRVIPTEVARQQASFRQPEVQGLIARHFQRAPEPLAETVPAAVVSTHADGRPRIRLNAPATVSAPTPEPLAVRRVSLTPKPQAPAQAMPEPQPARPDVADRLAAIIAAAIHADPAALPRQAPFAALGLDSVNGVEVVREINGAFGLALPSAILYDQPNIEALATFLGAEVAPAPAAPPPMPVAPLPTSFEPIAIIGVAGRFPGAESPEAFWENLVAGRDAISEPPPDRGWNLDHFYSANAQAPAKSVSKWAGFLTHVGLFDPGFFSMSHREAELTTPEQRLFLMETWKALEDAGYSDTRLSGTRCGVFVGVNQGDYPRLAGPQYAAQALTGLSPCGLASRISYLLNLRGPSMAIDTACSSSLVAINQACQSLHAGDCEMAIAGGVSLMLSPDMLILASKAGILSQAGRCAPFDAAANGIVLSEAAAAIVLKPLQQAQADGDPIWGVIRSIGVNQDGRTNGFSAPSAQAQAELARRVLERGGIRPEEITYIEAHGTGTPIGDPIELTALQKAYDVPGGPECVVSSAKGHVGHANTAAGVVGLIRILLQMRHGRIAPSLHFDTANPRSAAAARLRVRSEATPWNPPGPRLAALSSFGFTGTNAHAIIAEPPVAARAAAPRFTAYLLPVSGKTPAAARQQARNLGAWLQAHPEANLADVSYTLCCRRSHFAHRLAYIAQHHGDWQPDSPRYSGVADPSSRAAAPAQLDDWARAWVSAGLDLTPLFAGHTLRCLPLPSYPFELEHFWLEAAVTPTVTKPLIDGPDAAASLGRGLVYSKRLQASDWLLDDHRVRGQAVLPGVAYLEAALEAAALAGLGEMTLHDVQWLRPLLVDAEPVTLQLRLVSEEGVTQFEAHTEAGLHAKGRLRAATNEAPTTVPLDAIRARCSHHRSAEDLYERYRRIGVQYGPAFRTLRQVWGCATEALGELTLPAAGGDWLLHPALLDGALQAIAGLVVAEGEERLLLPFAAEAVTRYAPLTTPAWAWIEREDASRFHVTIAGQTGAVLVRIQGVALRPFRDPLAGMFHRPAWKPAPAAAARRTAPAEILLIEPVGGEAWRAAIAEWHPGARVHLAPASPGNFLDAFPAGWKPNALYHFASLTARDVSLDEAEQAGVVSLFRWIQALDQRGWRRQPIRVATATHRNFAITDEATLPPWSAAIHGFVKSAAREFPQWDVSCVDLESARPSSAAIDEPPTRDGMESAIRQGTRWARVLEPTSLPPAATVPFRSGGVYLIAGGTGGIGFQLSLHLATHFAARLIWLGRRARNTSIDEQILAIERAGGQVLYCPANLADRASVEAAVAAGQARFGAIHGAVHSVLDLRDASIANTTEADLMAVLAPKARGVLHLHEALPATLDFLLMFSSAQSFAGSPGQSSYSAACTFEDACGHHLRRLGRRAIVLNWGYWGTVGAVANAAVAGRMAAAGIRSIDPPEGMEAIHRVLASGQEQVLAMWADAGVRAKLGLADCDVAPADLARHRRSARVLNRFAAWTLRHALGRMGSGSSFEGLAVGVLPKYARLWQAFAGTLRRAHLLRVDGTLVSTPRVERILAQLPNHGESLLTRFPALRPHLRLLEVCAAALPGILTGETNPVEVLFPRGSLHLVSEIYRGNPLVDHCNRATAEAVARLAAARRQAHPEQPVVIVEVGAGTGATSAAILARLEALGPGIEFVYTDVSPRFADHGRRQFGAQFPMARFGVLDMEQPDHALVAPGSATVIVATNALHASRNIARTLEQLATLLAPGGWLVLNESTEPQEFASLTFGLTDGWWAFDDAACRIPDSPLLTEESWTALLAQSGFHAERVSQADVANVSPRQIVLTAELRRAAGRPAPRREVAAAPRAAVDTASPLPIAGYIKAVFAEVLKTPAARFDDDLTFDAFGIDSLVSQEINARFEADLGPVPAVMLFEHTTIRRLARYLENAYAAPLGRMGLLAAPEPPPAASPAPSLREQVYGLADAEVDALLERLLQRKV